MPKPLPYRLYNEDCFETFKRLKDKSIDLVLCDPPYGTTRCKWDSIIPLEPMWEALKRVAKPNAAMVFTATQPFTRWLIVSNIQEFKYDWVWDKVKPTNMLNASRQPLRRHESILVFYSSQPTYNPQKVPNPKGIEGRSRYAYKRANEGGETVGNIKRGGVSKHYEPDKLLPVSLVHCSKPNKPVHPTQKPVALMEYLIKAYTNEGDLVLDFAMGSGTTGVACGNPNRRFIGCDNDTEHGYFEIAKQRIMEAYRNSKK